MGGTVGTWWWTGAALLVAGSTLAPIAVHAAADAVPADAVTLVAPGQAASVSARADPDATTLPAATRGRALVAQRTRSLCLLCHHAPLEEERFQGDLGPDLAGVGARLSVAQLRQRLVDPAASNPATIMPSYARTEGLERVGKAWAGRPILDAQQIDDVVAWLSTLRN